MLRRLVLAVIAAVAVAGPAAAAEVKVAVAANFTEPARQIAARFKARTGHDAVLSYGSSGQFFTQIANGAPYGLAAVETMRELRLERALKPKLVMGTSITQAYQFVDTGAAEVGFVALSQLAGVKGGSRWVVPADLHTPIDQQAVLLRPGANSAAARAFLVFLQSGEARAIIRRYGYEVR